MEKNTGPENVSSGILSRGGKIFSIADHCPSKNCKNKDVLETSQTAF